jgi:hypothetical protein
MSTAENEVDSLEREVDRIRNNIGALVRELNHRRHEAFDLKLQFRQHAGRMVLVGVALASLIAGTIALAVARVKRRRSIKTRVTRLRDALRRMGAHPERVAKEQPNVPRKLLAAGGTAIASAIGKKLAKRLVSA